MSKLFDLSGKVALVTGASSGLGAHFAKCLGEAGASVVLAASIRGLGSRRLGSVAGIISTNRLSAPIP